MWYLLSHRLFVLVKRDNERQLEAKSRAALSAKRKQAAASRWNKSAVKEDQRTKAVDKTTMTYTVQDKAKVVWAAIGRRGVIGPFFFEENVTGISYLRLPQNQFYPAVRGVRVSIRIC
uniref:Uncharacterized protein n=1 Tax=Ditylenchus dipsaci TaxID=166011 RepID=A0A915CTX8_9BILA